MTLQGVVKGRQVDLFPLSIHHLSYTHSIQPEGQSTQIYMSLESGRKPVSLQTPWSDPGWNQGRCCCEATMLIIPRQKTFISKLLQMEIQCLPQNQAFSMQMCEEKERDFPAAPEATRSESECY